MPADEFEIIRTLFAPLARNDAARGLIDDVAVMKASRAIVVTTDAVVEGVHFRADDPIDLIAKKALRVNVSDIAAKGAKPTGALLTLIWPNHRPAVEISAFARGLGEDLRLYDITLLGGDTTSTSGPLTVSITLFGEPLGASTPSRADAKLGNDVWITGTLGDAWLGFEVLSGAWPEASAAHRNAVIARYQLPQPRLAFAPVIAAHARASMDVSDGLIADARKLATASGAQLRLSADSIPLSEAARAWVRDEGAGTFGRLLNWGDDYEALFTADPSARSEIETDANALGVPLTRIGFVAEGEGILVEGLSEESSDPGGYAHKLGQ
jgi:thiamine-monophosphate kinase